MTLPNYPEVNGIRHDWSCVRINIAGKEILGFKSISYPHALEPGEVRGTHAQPLGRTRGEYKPEGSYEMYKAEHAELLAILGDGYMEKSFSITISYSDAGPIITDRVYGCRIKKVDNSPAGGTDPTTVKVDLSVMAIVENGKKPLKNMLGV